MNSVKKLGGPPKPPRVSQTEPSSDPPKTDRPHTVCTPPPKKPPRVNQSDTTEYLDLNIARAYAAGVTPPSKNPMYSRVEVYAASITAPQLLRPLQNYRDALIGNASVSQQM